MPASAASLLLSALAALAPAAAAPAEPSRPAPPAALTRAASPTGPPARPPGSRGSSRAPPHGRRPARRARRACSRRSGAGPGGPSACSSSRPAATGCASCFPTGPTAAPRGSTRERVRLVRTSYRVEIDLSARRVTVLRAGRVVRRFRAVVGAPGTPTPRGRFAIYERARQPDPRGFLGPYALHLTAHSDVLDDYGGGPGRVAIHGRGGSSLRDPLGSAASHGCVRVDNAAVRYLARMLAPGVPVASRPRLPARWRSRTAHATTHKRARRASSPAGSNPAASTRNPRARRPRTTRSRSRRRTSPARCTWGTRSTGRSRTR